MSDLPIAREHRITVRALLLGDRIETAGLERSDVLSTLPLAFRAGEQGIVALFRYGVAVMVGMSPLEEDEVIRRLGWPGYRSDKPARRRNRPGRDRAGQRRPAYDTGIIAVKALTTEHTLLIADALATSVVLAHDKKKWRPFSASFNLSPRNWRSTAARPAAAVRSSSTSAMRFLVQHRISVWSPWQKTDVLWERPSSGTLLRPARRRI